MCGCHISTRWRMQFFILQDDVEVGLTFDVISMLNVTI